jgi:hypothetical protein
MNTITPLGFPQIWTEGLVRNILSLIHKQWIAHNVVTNDKKDLKVRNGKELVAAIITQFHMDVEGLLPQDQHLITCGRQAVKDMSATGQNKGLAELYTNCTLGTRNLIAIKSETSQLQILMHSWMNGAYF